MEKAAEKRKRREDRKLGADEPGESTELDPNDPYAIANYFAREAE